MPRADKHVRASPLIGVKPADRLEANVSQSFCSGRGGSWPKAAELSDATGRQLSGEHRTCCQLSGNGSLSHSRFRLPRPSQQIQAG
jgi:hypothetical protein